MSADQDGLLDVTSALPILQHHLARGVAGPQWRQRIEKEAIELYEATGTLTEYAVAVKLDLKCHLNEAFNALVLDDAETYTAAMQGFFGKKFKKSAILHRFDDENAHAKALVKTATFGNSLAKDVEFNFVDYRARNLEAKSATCVMKSLPKEFHEWLSKSSVLGGAKEIIACIHVKAASTGRTKVFFYASCSVDDESLDQKTSFNMGRSMHFLAFLAKSTTNFESIIRCRRLGFQSYIYSSSKALARSIKTCKVCEKSIGILRGDHNCQICGFRTCSTCSDTVNVEPKPGVLRTNRICKQCVELTDRCLFEDLDLDVLGPPIIAEVAVLPSFSRLQSAASFSFGPHRRDSSQSDRESDAKIVECLFSSDRSKQSLALDRLGVSRLLNTDSSFAHTSTTTTTFSYTVFDSILRQFLSQPVRLSVADCAVAEQDGQREYLLNFEEGLQIPEVPPAVDNEQIRQHSIHQIGFLSPSFQGDAFNIICEVAAKVMDCRTAYVSVVATELQCAIAHCNMSLLKLPRRETMCAYALTTDVPFIVPNAFHDIRFRQFFCIARARFRFYTSFPIEAPPALGGGIVASLVVMDKEPKKVVTNRQYSRMLTLTKVTSELLSALSCQEGAVPEEAALGTRHEVRSPL